METAYPQNPEHEPNYRRGSLYGTNDFINDLNAISRSFGVLIENFAHYTYLIAKRSDISPQLRSMMKFATNYHKYGLKKALKK